MKQARISRFQTAWKQKFGKNLEQFLREDSVDVLREFVEQSVAEEIKFCTSRWTEARQALSGEGEAAGEQGAQGKGMDVAEEEEEEEGKAKEEKALEIEAAPLTAIPFLKLGQLPSAELERQFQTELLRRAAPRSLLHEAARFGGNQILQLLILDYHLPVNGEDSEKRTPLQVACAAHQVETVRILLSLRGSLFESPADRHWNLAKQCTDVSHLLQPISCFPSWGD